MPGIRNIFPLLAAFLFCFCAFVSEIFADTHVAASCSYSHVNSAIRAASEGDTVLVPPGSCTWGSAISITKMITLQGAGKTQTKITRSGIPLISIDVTSANYLGGSILRITGFSLDGGNTSNIYTGVISLLNNNGITNGNPPTQVNNIRIDNNKLTGFGTGEAAIYSERGILGAVVDSNEFIITNTQPNKCVFQLRGANWYSWTRYPLHLGSGEGWYIEDNTFTFSGTSSCDMSPVLASEQGPRWTFRYNKVDASTCTSGFFDMFDAHGNQAPVNASICPNDCSSENASCCWTQSRAVVAQEVYENTLYVSTSGSRFFALRGGTSIVFNNTQTGSGSLYANMFEEDGSRFGYLSVWPGYDPIKDSYWFKNTTNGSEIGVGTIYPSDPTFIQADRDIWFYNGSFNGTSGVGVGLRSARPATCSPKVGGYPNTGPGYWATDERILYRCTATNTWTTYYTPYTYPHPLRMGPYASSAASPAPITAPKNLRIINP